MAGRRADPPRGIRPECDSEIEGRFAQRRHGGMLSLVAWLDAMQHLRDAKVDLSLEVRL